MFLLDCYIYILFLFKSLAHLVTVHFANSSMKMIAPRLLKSVIYYRFFEKLKGRFTLVHFTVHCYCDSDEVKYHSILFYSILHRWISTEGAVANDLDKLGQYKESKHKVEKKDVCLTQCGSIVVGLNCFVFFQY